MLTNNPFEPLKQEAIRANNKVLVNELDVKSREFIENKLNELKKSVDDKLSVLTDYDNELKVKSDRKRIKEIYNEAIKINRVLRDDIIPLSIELKAKCRLVLFGK